MDDLDSLTDEELLRRSRHDAAAFRTFYDRRAPALGRYLLRETGSEDAAADLAAETFAKVWSSLWRFRGHREDSGVAFLYGIARNEVRGYRRRRRVASSSRARLGMQLVSDGEGGRAPSELDDLVERHANAAHLPALHSALRRLPERQRQAVHLRVVDGREFPEVAATIGCTENAARLLVSRALAVLEKELTP